MSLHYYWSGYNILGITTDELHEFFGASGKIYSSVVYSSFVLNDGKLPAQQPLKL